MIHDASTFRVDVDYDADLCVVGSGAGGAMAAAVAAEAGLRVVVLEAGPFVAPEYMSQREDWMIPQLLVDAGAQATTDLAVKVHQGRGVGGSTLHNLNLCKPAPPAIRALWRRERGLEHLSDERWAALYERVERELAVSDVEPERWNRHNLLLRDGAQARGWRWSGMRHNRSGCVASGFCELGCAYDAKNNAAKVLMPRLVAAGGAVFSWCRAERLRVEGDRVVGVDAVALDPATQTATSRVRVRAAHVCVSASATRTPALLRRSNIPAPAGSTGDTLRIHPAVIAAGDFDEPVFAWRGIPQTVECTEFLDLERAHADPSAAPPRGTRSWIVNAFAHPVGTAVTLPGIGREHREAMQRYPNLAVLTSVLHDLTAGSVRPAGDGVKIRYAPSADDRAELAFGLARCADLLFAAGARRVWIPTATPLELTRPDQTAALESLPLTPGSIDITAVHPMGTVPMGDDPAVAAVDSRGRHHHVAGLSVADGSLFPTSIGGPPQLTIYALGLHVGEAIVADAQ